MFNINYNINSNFIYLFNSSRIKQGFDDGREAKQEVLSE